MKTILNASLSASGSPSEVKQRITDQVKAAGEASPDQSAALGVARSFIEKTIASVSEDDTLSVNASITVSVMDAPPIVLAKVAAAEDKTAATEKTLASVRAELETAKGKLTETAAALEALRAAKTETPAGV